jgi:lysophospholipase L1-like esterase
MKVSEKIKLGLEGLKENGPIVIVALGDSITHGGMTDYVDQESAYHSVLRKKLLEYRDYYPVSVINSGIGGTRATLAYENLEKRAFRYSPDLIIVCFGLNDVHDPIENYLNALEGIFRESQKRGIDVIFMTPNMMNTRVAEDTAEELLGFAERTAKEQNEGLMDKYIYSAKELAESMGVPVCDCYSKWKELSKTEDVTNLLINRINHPTPKMHELFAESLFKMIIEE